MGVSAERRKIRKHIPESQAKEKREPSPPQPLRHHKKNKAKGNTSWATLFCAPAESCGWSLHELRWKHFCMSLHHDNRKNLITTQNVPESTARPHQISRRQYIGHEIQSWSGTSNTTNSSKVRCGSWNKLMNKGGTCMPSTRWRMSQKTKTPRSHTRRLRRIQDGCTHERRERAEPTSVMKNYPQ